MNSLIFYESSVEYENSPWMVGGMFYCKIDWFWKVQEAVPGNLLGFIIIVLEVLLRVTKIGTCLTCVP